MRAVLLTVFFIGYFSLFAQSLLEQRISVSFKKASVEKCLRLIEKETKKPFSYNSRQIHHISKKLTKSYENVALSEILDDIFHETAIQYKEIGKQITIYEVQSSSGTAVLSGYIRDSESGEELIGAKMAFPEHGVGCITNSYGYYSIELPKGPTSFYISSVGMLRISNELQLEDDMVMNFKMDEDTVLLRAVEVLADSVNKEIEMETDLPYLDKIEISAKELKKVPAANGELDVFKYLQQFPGVQPASGGGARYQVRGSGTGNNLILLDEIPIYHPTHLLGLYSIINSDALKSATLYKDHIPVRFGTRNSSVLQVHTKEGNLKRHHLSGSLGFISARVNWEGPIVKNRASFYISARRSTFPAIAGRFLQKRQLTLPTFFDINAKVNVKLNSNNRIYLTLYTGQDNLRDSVAFYSWGNDAVGLRWNNIINNKTFSNLSITHSEFHYGYSFVSPITYENFSQSVASDRLNYDITNFYSNSLKFNFGLSLASIRTLNNTESGMASDLFLQRNAFENGVYFSFEKQLNHKWNVEGGVRVPFSFHIGTQDSTAYLNDDFTLTPVVYEKNKFYDPMVFVDPRILISHQANHKNLFQFSSGLTSQHTHIINYVNYFLPIELWTTSNAYLKPERNIQTSLGWVHKEKSFQTSLTLYHRHVRNVLDYASPIFTSSMDIESNLLSGHMNALGAEFMVNYQLSTRYSIAFSYAYTLAKQKVKGINKDEPYNTLNSTPHYVSINQFFNLSKKWKLSTNFIFHSGRAITLPNGQFTIDGTAFPLYSDNRNAERLRSFSRWDVALTRRFGVKRRKDRVSLTLNITNFYGRFNPAVVYVEQSPVDPGTLNLNSIDYTPFMIYLNLNFKL
ncbi:MAG: TonB-dependent receptor [Flavobacteriales bacterium]|nr:TonB-dependent receptor [Flavobacteriales bacterium]